MRYIFFFSLFILPGILLRAQQFQVKVQMDNGQTPLAYVLVNDRPAALTDSEGIALIDPSGLREGDRISASFVGATSDVIVYSGEIAKAGSCLIVLTPNFIMDEVVVKPTLTGWDIFCKYTNIPKVMEKKHDTSLEFTYTWRLPEEKERVIAGRIIMNKGNSNLSRWNYDEYIKNLVILTRDDTVGITQRLLTDLYFTLQVSNGAIYRIGDDIYRDPYSPLSRPSAGRILFSFQHQGVENDERIFLVTNDAYQFGSSRPLRYLFRVDNRNRNVRSVESIHLLPRSLFNQRTCSTYELYRHRWLKPRTAELESVNPETGTSYHLSLSKIEYNSLSKKERKMLYEKEAIQKTKQDEKYRKRKEKEEKQRREEFIPLFY